MKPSVFCLMGPTAIGKTDLACELTLEFPFELVSVDSSLVYKELSIGAAKPSEEILKQYPHHLINCCDLSHIYSVAQFRDDAEQLIRQIYQRGHFPLLVGGTMMYFHALQHGLASLPPSDAEIRKQLMIEAGQSGWEKLYEKLQAIDPVSASRLHVNDKQRILRGLEIFETSGKNWSDWLLENKQSQPFSWHNLVLLPEPRAWLHERIATRLTIMIASGFLEEVQTILAMSHINIEHPALKSVGYRQAISYLQGEEDSNWIEKTLFATRQLAKRQMTWLRSMEQKNEFYCPNKENKIRMIALIKKILDNV
jgi:tRNA dimethylallyltransferase